jgi:ubiquinone/menaquinone biosynthesis C-methylase UbiE
MVRSLGLPAGGRVLEVGCGRGVAMPALARLLGPARLAGLDLDAGLLDEARARANAAGIAVELVPGDVRRMPFPDGSFDLVVDFGTCYHMARVAQALAEIARVLAPGGLFVHETPLSQLFAHPLRSFGRHLRTRTKSMAAGMTLRTKARTDAPSTKMCLALIAVERVVAEQLKMISASGARSRLTFSEVPHIPRILRVG